MNTQNLQGSVQLSRQLQLLVKDRYDQVDRDRDPYLCLHRVGTVAVEMLDSKVLLDPSKEEFDLPAQPVQRRDIQGRQGHLVAKENKRPFLFGIVVANFPQRPRKVSASCGKAKLPDLVASDAVQIVHRTGAMPGESQVVFGASHKERAGLRDASETSKVDIGAIHDVEGARLVGDRIEPSHIVHTGRGDIDYRWYRSSQIELRMQLDSGFRRTKTRPTKKRQRQIDRRRVQGVNRLIQLDAQIFVRIQPTRLADQTHCQVPPQLPISLFVGIRKSRTGHRILEAHVIERFGSGVQARLDIAEAVSPSELSKDHADQLLATSKMPDSTFGPVAPDQPIQSLTMYHIEKLRDNVATCIHGTGGYRFAVSGSNASHLISSANYCNKANNEFTDLR